MESLPAHNSENVKTAFSGHKNKAAASALQGFLNSQVNRTRTLKASGRTSAITIHIMHPAAKPVQKGRTFWNASAQRKAGTATIGWIYK
jgi:hypothetical protein